jgi:hypothetical protein
MIDDGDLDALLSAPLARVADDGFSVRLANAIARRQAFRERALWTCLALLACAPAPFLPIEDFAQAALRLGPALSGSLALSLAAAALVLTITFERRYRDWDATAL